MLDYGLKEI